MLLLLALVLGASACRSTPAGRPLEQLPKDAKAIIALAPLPRLKQHAFEFLYNVPGLEGIADHLHYRFGLDLEGDSEGVHMGLAMNEPLAAFLRGSFWVLVLPLADEDRFQGYLSKQMQANGFDAAPGGIWTRGRWSLVSRVSGGLAWLARAPSDSAAYLASELDDAIAGDKAPAMEIDVEDTASVQGDWYALMSALDPLSKLGDIPLTVRSAAYGFGALDATLRLSKDGLKLKAGIDAGGNHALVAALGGGGEPRVKAIGEELKWAAVASLVLRLDPSVLGPILPSPLGTMLDGSLVAALGIPSSPAKLIRQLTETPGTLPWREIPWIALAGRRDTEPGPNPKVALGLRYRWVKSGLLFSSSARGRGEAGAGRPAALPRDDTILALDVSFRAIYEALRETDLFPFALRLLSGPRELHLRLSRATADSDEVDPSSDASLDIEVSISL